ncbi:MAG: hypothetical protein R2877_03595 [Bdellovibrionota bacterium]
MGYEMPVSERLRLGIPFSYTTGDGFSSMMFGADLRYGFYTGFFSISPVVGIAGEHFFGNGKSFQAASVLQAYLWIFRSQKI